MPFHVRGREQTVHLVDTDFELIRASKDGNCLFHAAGHGLVVAGLLLPPGDNHAALRAQVVQYVADHAKETTALGEKLRDGLGISHNQRNAVTPAQSDAIDRRVAYLRGAAHWGDEACITAIERLYDVEVLVYDDTGGDQALGVAYYEPSHAKAAKLRLCIRLVGHTPVHYDVYLPDHDALRDGDNVAVQAPEKGSEVSQSAEEPWAYHMNPDGLKLFCPAIAPRQFAYSRDVVDALGKKRKVKVKPVAVALGNQLNVIQPPPAPVVAVHLVNHFEKAELGTRSFSAATDPDLLPLVVQEPLVLPLVRVDEAYVNLLDLSSTDLVIDVARGEAPAPATLFLRVYRRAFGRLGADVPHGGLLDQIEIDLTKIKHESKDLDEPARTRFTFAASLALPDHLTCMMTWHASPFQFVASSDKDFDAAASAWTHAHVPSEHDLLTTERLARVRVLMLDDSPMVLADLGVDASVEPLANLAISEGEPATGREEFDMPADQKTALRALIPAVGLGNVLDTNKHNYLVQVGDDEWYASTSWASMASLEHDAKDGRYYLVALYWFGSDRAAYVATADDLADPNARTQGADLAALARAVPVVGAARTALSNALAVTGGAHKAAFAALRAKRVYDAMFVFNSTEREENRRLTEFRGLHDTAIARIGALRQNAEATAILAKLDLDTGALALPAFRDDAQPIVQMLDLMECAKLCDAMYKALFTQRADLLQKGIPLAFEAVEGVKDFDLEGGGRLKPGNDWKRHVFDPPLKLTCAVTPGISSCAGGVTVSDEETPAHVLMWHVDATPSIPLLAEMERLWPKGKDAPVFRTLAVVTPSLWELNKYRPDNLYPATVAKDCVGVFLGRGPHWYSTMPVVAGCDLFGVDLRTEGQADLVFTYDIDKRRDPIQPWSGLEEASEDTPMVLAHFRQQIFGTYRYDDADPKTAGELIAYTRAVATEEPAEAALIKRHKRAENNKSCRVPALNAALIDAVAKQARPLLELDRLLVGEKGDLDVSRRVLDQLLNERWLPGSRKT